MREGKLGEQHGVGDPAVWSPQDAKRPAHAEEHRDHHCPDSEAEAGMADDAIAQGDDGMAGTALAGLGRRRACHITSASCPRAAHCGITAPPPQKNRRRYLFRPRRSHPSNLHATTPPKPTPRSERTGVRQKSSPENITLFGSYFCRTDVSRDRFAPK